MEFPAHELRKHFKVGDHVKVIAGRYEGDTGLIIRVEENAVVLFSDLTMHEVLLNLEKCFYGYIDACCNFFNIIAEYETVNVDFSNKLRPAEFFLIRQNSALIHDGAYSRVAPIFKEKKESNFNNTIYLFNEPIQINKKTQHSHFQLQQNVSSVGIFRSL